MSPARREAFRILHRVETSGAYATYLLASRRLDRLSLEDRRLTYELVLGVLRWRRQLDYFIERYARRRLDKLELPVIIALRLGLYQIRFLERIPEWAAVHESVELVKAYGAKWAASLVNAVLRRACRRKKDVPGQGIADEGERLSIRFSHPRWLVEKWIARFGREETIALMEANNRPPQTAFRTNPWRCSPEAVRAALERDGIVVEPSAFVPGAYLVKRGVLSNASTLVRQGRIYLQDEASQLVVRIVEPRPGASVLDVCAAPGGKSSHLAMEMDNRGRIVAGDIHLHRLRLLERMCQRLGATIVYPVALDGTRALPFLPGVRFDRVLVDAPCSGTGTLRRHPEIKWRLRPDDLRALADVQLRLLQSAAPLVASGGFLIYSTCSLEWEENEAVVERFLAEVPSFTIRRPALDAALLTDRGFLQTFPHRHGMDGFFAAVFVAP